MVVPIRGIPEPKWVLPILVIVWFLVGMFLSIAGMFLLNALLFSMITLLTFETVEGGILIELKRHRPWRRALTIAENSLVYAFATLLFVKIPLGAIYYMGQ